MDLNISLPDRLYNTALIYTKNIDLKFEEFINFQFASFLEKYLMNSITERAKKVTREEFKRILSEVPDVEPPEYDRL
jgi:hypothetical protein